MGLAQPARTRKLRRGPPPNTVEIYSIGWTRCRTYAILFAWFTVFAVAVGVTVTNISVEHVNAWILGIGAVTFLPVFVLVYAGKDLRARRPLVTMTKQGATTPDSGFIRWGAILRIYVSGDPLLRDLYIELRDPLRTRKGMDRFLLLHEGTELSKFRVVASDGEERTIAGTDLAQELQDLHLAYAAAGGLGAKEATPPSAALPIPAKEEIVIPQALSDRWVAGIMGALIAAGAVAFAAMLAWVLFIAKADGFTGKDGSPAIEALVVMFVVALVMFFFVRQGARILAASLGGKPLLVVDRSGLTHVKFGFIPWSEITSIQVDGFGENEQPAACAYLTENFYRRRLHGRPFERLGLTLRNINWKFQLTPRLPLIWGFTSYSRKDYVRNGLAMPPVTVEELARLIREFSREGSNKSMGA